MGDELVLGKLCNQTMRVANKGIHAYRLAPEPIRMAFGRTLIVVLLLANTHENSIPILMNDRGAFRARKIRSIEVATAPRLR